MKPMSDLCASCIQISRLNIRSANVQSEETVTEAMQRALDHRNLVKKERGYYKDILKEAQLLLNGLCTDVADNYNPPLTMPLALLHITALTMLHRLTILQVHYKQVQLIILLPGNVAYLDCALKLSLSRLIF
uniref:Uncharacterized protein n=1 Tax=Amphimedon queenslandica TaxID=400682 RepID=A0A1X7V6Q8_AMPQE